MAGLEPEKNEESWYFDETHDDEDVYLWSIKGCPLSEDCKLQSWKRSNCWSMVSEERARKYLKQHLTHSAHHASLRTDPELINSAVEAAECEIIEYTVEERREYRESLKKEQPKASKRQDEEDPPKKRQRKSSEGKSHEVQELTASIMELKGALAEIKSGPASASGRPAGDTSASASASTLTLLAAGSSGLVSSTKDARRTITLPVTQAKLTLDTIQRCNFSVGNILSMLSQRSSSLRSEADVCDALRQQLQSESDVLTQAQLVLRKQIAEQTDAR